MKITEKPGPNFKEAIIQALRKFGQAKSDKETKTGGKKSG